MTPLTFDKQRLAPWLRLAFVAYLAFAVVLTLAHQHHGTQTGDCGLCTSAHTPAMVAPVAGSPAPVVVAATPIAPTEDRIAESAVRFTTPSRAPPQS